MSKLGEALLPGVVHLWLADCAAIHDPALLARYRELLSEEEYARQQRYRFERDRHRDLIARALVRTSLSRYAGVEPENWRFEQGEHGKPRLVEAPETLNFNLSHSHERVVCAIARNPIGVDIEYCGRANDVLAIAERYFSAIESRDLFCIGAASAARALFRLLDAQGSLYESQGRGDCAGPRQLQFQLFSERGYRGRLRRMLAGRSRRVAVQSH